MVMLLHTKSQISCNALLQNVNHPFVSYFSYETSMAEEQESLNMTHSRLGIILPSYLVPRLSFPSKRGRVAEKPQKRCWMLV